MASEVPGQPLQRWHASIGQTWAIRRQAGPEAPNTLLCSPSNPPSPPPSPSLSSPPLCLLCMKINEIKLPSPSRLEGNGAGSQRTPTRPKPYITRVTGCYGHKCWGQARSVAAKTPGSDRLLPVGKRSAGGGDRLHRERRKSQTEPVEGRKELSACSVPGTVSRASPVKPHF